MTPRTVTIADLMLAAGAYHDALKALIAARRRYKRAVTAHANAATLPGADANTIAHTEGTMVCAREVMGAAYGDVVDAEVVLKNVQTILARQGVVGGEE